MSRPIEKGCLALVIHGYASGHMVTVGGYVGSLGMPTPIIDHDLWEVDTLMTYFSTWNDETKMLPYIPEKYLMRIDGEEFEDENEAHREADIVTVSINGRVLESIPAKRL